MEVTAVFRLIAGVLIGCLAFVGCSGDQQPPDDIATSESSFDKGLEAFQAEDFATAEKILTNAINGTGLNSDLLAEALLLRAEARLKTGMYTEALADLTELEPVAPDLSEVHRVRGDVYIAQNDLASAKTEYAAAKKLNPGIQIPAKLK